MAGFTRHLLYFGALSSSDSLAPEITSKGWTVHVARDTRTARELIGRQDFRVGLVCCNFLTDGQTRDMQELYLASSHTHWVALVPQSCMEVANVAKVIRDYFYDFHTLPADPARLLVTLGHAYGMAELLDGSKVEYDTMPEKWDMVGDSAVMKQLFRNIRKVASVNAPVLIGGESGTGKELTARAIHQQSARADGPFVAVNCGALPSSLIQSELFGHEKGSFTGADKRRTGRIEAAAGGTIFLDEIGDLSHDLQVNLLRFLQENTIDRVGSSAPVKVDVRVVAATHANLEQAVADGTFREDLYYRLNVLHVNVPPLRERGEDVELLAHFFFRKFSGDRGIFLKGFSEQALRVMVSHTWPGNVRELVNRIQRAVVMCDDRLIRPLDLGLERRSSVPGLATLSKAREVGECLAIKTALRHCRNNVSRAADILGVSRVTLYRLIDKHAIAVGTRSVIEATSGSVPAISAQRSP
jgi:DNA-binding NtrC family response regulator